MKYDKQMLLSVIYQKRFFFLIITFLKLLGLEHIGRDEIGYRRFGGGGSERS
jgi:hypothetical protein